MSDLSVSTILSIYSAEEIPAQITRLKAELENLYTSVSASGRSGSRDIAAVRADLNAFAEAKAVLDGKSGGIVRTQAV